jgi:hypothetical protein
MSELLTIIVDARTAQEAQEAARLWARAEPGIRLRTITRVRPAPPPAAMPAGNEWHDKWAVELAYVNVEPGLGL